MAVFWNPPYREMEETQRKVDQLYARWTELEEKVI